MSVKTLTEVAETYFHTLNPIAERISVDICTTKDAYENLWHCLSFREREQIIDETLIHPEVVLKYALTVKTIDTRVEDDKKKLIVDETSGHSWRDEHSAPFSWKTPSQLNLSIFGKSDSTSPKKHINLNKVLATQACVDEQQKNGTFYVPFESNGNIYDKDKINGDAPDSPNIVLGGTAAKGIRSKFSFIPGKAFGTEVKNLISFSNLNSDESSILTKLRANTMSKIQNTIKLVGGKNVSTERKATSNPEAEAECLVHQKNITITRLQKPSPKNVSKPKSPPPPPPVMKPDQTALLKNKMADEKASKPKMIISKKTKPNDSKTESETAGLLDYSPSRSLKTDAESKESDGSSTLTRDLSYISKEFSVDAESNSESNGLSSHSTKESGFTVSQSNSYADAIPKSGFDFLDNW